MKTVKCDVLSEFLMAEKKVWALNGELAGYVQKWGNLSHVLVFGAGHILCLLCPGSEFSGNYKKLDFGEGVVWL